jgi:L-asparaginase / beta-aspartyl-peptidase
MYSIAIHGGAGTILKSMMTAEKEKIYKDGLNKALNTGIDILKNGGSALNAVEQAVIELENFDLFNAGRGSVFTNNLQHEMDASIMCGKSLNAGAVAGVQEVKNPIVLSRKVMEESEHVLLSGKGALDFAKKMNIPLENENYFFTTHRYLQLLNAMKEDKVQLDHTLLPDEKKFGTVGAVALDEMGNVAAATSTGGMTNKKYGRLGDTPIIGAGTYANNNTCAVSCTGHGEYFIKSVVAYDVSCLIEYKNFSLQQACNEVVHNKLVKIGGEGGLIALDKHGNIELVFNSEGMYRAAANSQGLNFTEIYK